MAIGGQVDLPEVVLADIGREARAWPHPEERARGVTVKTIERAMGAIDNEVIPGDSDVARSVRERAERLLV